MFLTGKVLLTNRKKEVRKKSKNGEEKKKNCKENK